jgi:hypothetical protein
LGVVLVEQALHIGARFAAGLEFLTQSGTDRRGEEPPEQDGAERGNGKSLQ